MSQINENHNIGLKIAERVGKINKKNCKKIAIITLAPVAAAVH
jgi:hypothetical protein